MAVEALTPQETLRAFARLAARLFRVRIAYCTWGLERAGEDPDLLSGAESLPFETEASKSQGVFVVIDAAEDLRFESHFAVGGPGRIRFYASAWLGTEAHAVGGRLALADFHPRPFSSDDAALLSDLAAMATAALDCPAQRQASLRRLASAFSHDFENCLTIVRGHCELLLGQLTPDDPIREQVEEIQQGGKRAAALNHSLRRFGRTGHRHQILDLNDLIRAREQEIRRRAGEAVEVVFEYHPGAVWIRINGEQIAAGMMQLAERALRVMSQHGRLHISTREVTLDPRLGHPAKFVVLTVKDTGPAMDPKSRDRIFEPFASPNNIELAILYSHVTQLFGDIRVTSEPGSGSTFEIYLPAGQGLVSPEVAASDVAGGTETILIVDDDANMRTFLAWALEFKGYRVLQGANLAEALAQASAHPGPIDLVVTDMLFPDANGIEVARELQRIRPGIKAIYMSGSVSLLFEVDDSPSLGKPFTRDAFWKLVRRVLDDES